MGGPGRVGIFLRARYPCTAVLVAKNLFISLSLALTLSLSLSLSLWQYKAATLGGVENAEAGSVIS